MGVGTLVAVVAAVALLAVSGESGVWRITVLVAFAVALGTLSAVLLSPTAARRRAQRVAPAAPPARSAGGGQPAQPEPTATRQRAYAHQSR
ncbi:hypothetical protein HUT16_12235 [Kitasatospora sp. NA04385]|uniref:hypothetical protein n=1 Tax=Kitasatospora sp. NA04385 TaxID=2742135 RepID=UPI001591EB49|nr:hypothetical protein [Kitasatospora sp. NA04385]QKW19725.1 hypothetical protein HUT16_12235 [Kitasatospora sp. NA04385]